MEENSEKSDRDEKRGRWKEEEEEEEEVSRRARRGDADTGPGLAHDEHDNNDFSSATTGLTWGMRWRTTLRGYVTTHETNISELSGFVANLDRASRAKLPPDLTTKECESNG